MLGVIIMLEKRIVSLLVVVILILLSISPCNASTSTVETEQTTAKKRILQAEREASAASTALYQGNAPLRRKQEMLSQIELQLRGAIAEKANVAERPKSTLVDSYRAEKSIIGYEAAKKGLTLDIKIAKLNLEVLEAELAKKRESVIVAEKNLELIKTKLHLNSAKTDLKNAENGLVWKTNNYNAIYKECEEGWKKLVELRNAVNMSSGEEKAILQEKLKVENAKFDILSKDYKYKEALYIGAKSTMIKAQAELVNATGSIIWADYYYKQALENEYAAQSAAESLAKGNQEVIAALAAAKVKINNEANQNKALCDAKCALELADNAAKAAAIAAENANGKSKAAALAAAQEAERKALLAKATVEQLTASWNEAQKLTNEAQTTLDKAIDQMHAPTPPPKAVSNPTQNPIVKPAPQSNPTPTTNPTSDSKSDSKSDPKPEPKPDPKPIAVSGIDNIAGTAHVGVQLTVGSLTPAPATATFQWEISSTADGAYTVISGETTNLYTVKAEDVGKYIRVKATGTGEYTNTVVSTCIGPVSSMELNKLTATHYLGEVDEEVVTVNLANMTFDHLEVSGNPLILNTDYSVSGNQVTLKASYMNHLPQGNTVISFKGSNGVLCPFTLYLSGATLSAAPIANGQINPSTLTEVTGGSFTANVVDPANWDIDTGTTGLVVQSIAFHGLGTSRAVTISFTGIANTGVINLRPKGISLAGGVLENGAQITVPAAKTTCLKSYTPVVFSQSGDILNNTVQYKTAANVIAALPSTISVLLDDDVTLVDVPVIWTDTDSYRSDTSKWYTFTGTWGIMPAGANNDNNIAAPTVSVYVAMMP